MYVLKLLYILLFVSSALYAIAVLKSLMVLGCLSFGNPLAKAVRRRYYGISIAILATFTVMLSVSVLKAGRRYDVAVFVAVRMLFGLTRKKGERCCKAAGNTQ